MQEVLKFLQECGAYYLATATDGKPHVRPIGFVMIYEGKLCFCTNNKKDMYRQMKENPFVEISGTAPNREWIRLYGEAEFVTTREAKHAALEAMPVLRRMYSEDDSLYEIFAVVNATAEIRSMAGEKRTITF